VNHHLVHVGFQVPDIRDSIEHFESVLGVTAAAADDDRVWLALPGARPCLVLTEGPEAVCDHAALVTSGENLSEIRTRADRAGFVTDDALFLDDGGVRLVAPNGLVVEVGAGPIPARNAEPREIGPVISGIDHVSLTATDLPATVAFFRDVLGFRLSDSVEDKRHWLRCGPNHHTVAVFEGPDGLQHYAFATEDLNQLGRLGDLLATRGQNFIWGLGRHGLGANMFSYHLDPAGGVLEVCCGMIQVDDEEAWVTQVWRADTLDSALMWGPPPPPEFRQLGIPTRAEVRQ
jgi:catechol 2,3-dioxygenase-like lactoylglutathione lyase family enzyme